MNEEDSIYSSYSTGGVYSENLGELELENFGGFIGYNSYFSYDNSGWIQNDGINFGLPAIGRDSSTCEYVGEMWTCYSTELIEYNEISFNTFFNYLHGVYTAGESVWDFNMVWDRNNFLGDYPVHRWQTGNVPSIDVDLVSPEDSAFLESQVEFKFISSVGLEEQELLYCNVSAISERTTGISSQNGLIALWHFDGDVLDYSGNSADGVSEGGEYNYSDYKVGNASYYFDGESIIYLPNNSIFTEIGDFTVSVWIKAELFDGYNSILAMGDAGDEWLFSIDDRKSDIYGYYGYYGNLESESNLSLNEWQHIVIVRKENNFSFYIDGVLDVVRETDIFDNLTVSGNLRAIGSGGFDEEGFDEPFYGYLDELAIWNRALSDEEILELYGTYHRNSSSSIILNQENSISLNLPVGNYSWSVSCTDNLGLTETSERRSLSITGVLEDIVEENNTQQNPTTSSYSPKTYFSDVKLPTEGNNFNLRVLDKIKFVVRQNNHTLTMQNFNSTHARVKIESEPIINWIEKNILYEFDLNNDSVNDVRVRYEGINQTTRQAMIFIQEIVKEEKVEVIENKNIVDEFMSIAEKSNYFWYVLGMTVLVCVIIYLIFLKRINEYLRMKRLKRAVHYTHRFY